MSGLSRSRLAAGLPGGLPDVWREPVADPIVKRGDDVAEHRTAASLPDWTGPAVCPFCGSELDDGGPGFIDHIEGRPRCESSFRVWRDRVADDIKGGWSG